MSEADAIAKANPRGPATVSTLVEDLRVLGVEAGQTLIVHASLSQLGWVAGGAAAVTTALGGAVGDSGTLVMPTHTGHLTDPSNWSNPPVPEAWWETIRRETPPFDPERTASRFMGALAETFRTLPRVVRSDHPVGSFAARGPRAAAITAAHPLGAVFGDASPLGRLYDMGALVLLLGVGHDNNTSLHLAESRVRTETRPQGSPVLRDGRRVWAEYQEPLHDSDDFPAIGEAYAAAGGTIRTGVVGSGGATLVPMREIVDYAVRWMAERDRSEV